MKLKTSKFSMQNLIILSLLLCTSCSYVSKEQHEKNVNSWYNQKIALWEKKLKDCTNWCDPTKNTLIGLKGEYLFFKGLPKEKRGVFNRNDYGY